MIRSLCEAAKYVLERFKYYGADVPASSRFIRMDKGVCNDDGGSRGFISETDPEFDHAREALRDFSQLEFFFDQIAADPDKNRYADIINRILNDSVLPQGDKRKSTGRDAQAEAFVFAVCRNAGMNPLLEEPDVVCEVGQERFGIAVKRLKALSQFEKRLKNAAKQIQGSGLLGVISLEVTLAVNPKNHSIVTTQGESEVQRWWVRQMRERVNQLDERVLPSIGARGVLGVFLHEHCPIRIRGNYVLRSMTYGIETASGDKKALWPEFKRTFVKGLPNLQV